ncbi:hypothetical protein FB567DRAFT_357048 [Paraphoma chrysanthemicola]|uniref:Uncharacterized protein n=1 Tax=Paraphoma chrysanthemicola TaxID=798071 RepID=A0A8K0R8G8_9PLEO|nr:hypothetical protein FB567DRAFT_357048 [Paraphoma chrysanthemicola]
MWKIIRLLFYIDGILSILRVSADEIELPQGRKIAIDIFEKLQAAHEVAIHQKVQEDLYLSLPLSASNLSESVTVANINASIPRPKNRIRKVRTLSARSSLDRRANECDGELWYEGQDPCEGREQDPRFKPCLPACQFTRDWFVNNAARKPLSSQCLFYTSGLSETAREFADRHNGQFSNQLKTIWHIWERDPWMRYADRDIDNPMRCIIQGDIFEGVRNMRRQRYFEGMSDAMAYMCGGKAVVMDRNMRRGRTGRMKQAGIWNQVEFPRLKMEAGDKWQGRVVNVIDAIGEQTTRDTKIWWAKWWVRGGPDWPSQASRPLKRDSLEENETDGDLYSQNLTKRDYEPWDTSIFDEGGRMSIDW